MRLTQEQRDVIRNITNDIKKGNNIVKLGGLAGVGKTTIIFNLIQLFDNWRVCAYTGKAVQVLKSKGIDAQTIHSLIYIPLKDANNNIIVDANNNPTFVLAPSLSCEGIIIDESSMVSEEIDKDLKTFNIPIIYIGDHGQLQPIGDNSFNIMKNPDYKLETIHRNAGPIAHFASFIRKGYRPSAYKNHYSGPEIEFLTKKEAYARLIEPDQIICAYNKTRVELNEKIREMKGFTDKFPCVGDRLMCLRNNKLRLLYNGMQGVVTKIFQKPKNKMIFVADEREYELFFDPSALMQEKPELSYNRNDPDPFDYAYATTCHKFQGSEAKSVMVFEQKCQAWEHSRWAYTAASRAKEKLIWIEC